MQSVQKVSLRFQKFITEANEKTDEWKLLQNETYIFKFFFSMWAPLVARSTSRQYSIPCHVAYSHQWWQWNR